MEETFDITFQYYQNIFGSKRIKDEQTFNQLLPLAVQYVTKYANTYQKPDFSTIMGKGCICAVCEILNKKKDLEALESESFDTFTKNYKSVDWDKEILDIMFMYLPEKCMYRGVDENA